MNHSQMRNSLLSFSPFHQKKKKIIIISLCMIMQENDTTTDWHISQDSTLTLSESAHGRLVFIPFQTCEEYKNEKKNINSLFITALPALMVTEVRLSLLCRVKAGLRHQLASCMSWTVGGNQSTSKRSHTDAVRTCKLHKEMPWIRTKLATYLLWAAAVKAIMPKSYL